MKIGLVGSNGSCGYPDMPGKREEKLRLVLARLAIGGRNDREEIASLLAEMIEEGEDSGDEELRAAALSFDRDLGRIAEPKGFSLAGLWYLCCCFFERFGLDSAADRFAKRLATCPISCDGRRDLFNDFRVFFDKKYGLSGEGRRLEREEDLMRYVQFLDASIRLFPQQAREWILQERCALRAVVGQAAGLPSPLTSDRRAAAEPASSREGNVSSGPLYWEGPAMDRYRSLLDFLSDRTELAPVKSNGIERQYLSFSGMEVSNRRKQFYLELATCFERSLAYYGVKHYVQSRPLSLCWNRERLQYDGAPFIKGKEASDLGLIINEEQRARADLKVVPFCFHGACRARDFQCCAYNILDGTPSRLKEIFESVKEDLDKLKPNEVPVFVGCSMGGMLAHACGAYFHRTSVGFNPLGCGEGVRKSIGDENWLRAMYEDGSKHISLFGKGDWVNDRSPITKKPLPGQTYKLDKLYESSREFFGTADLHNEVFALVDEEDKPPDRSDFSEPVLMSHTQVDLYRKQMAERREWFREHRKPPAGRAAPR